MIWYLICIEHLRKIGLCEINAIYREKHSASCRKSVEEVLRADMKRKIDNDIGRSSEKLQSSQLVKSRHDGSVMWY